MAGVGGRLGRLEQAKRVRVGESKLSPELEEYFDALDRTALGEEGEYDWSEEYDPELRAYFAELEEQKLRTEWLLKQQERTRS